MDKPRPVAPTLPLVSFPDPLERTPLRRAVYAILIVLALANMTGRILSINAVDMIRLEQNLIDREVKSRLDKRIAELTAGATAADKVALEREIRAEVSADPRIRKQRPFLSANDRSRWATVRAVVEHGTYAIDDVIAEPNWDTIDMVQHKDRDGVRRLYSSKPPLLATVRAIPYWMIYTLTGGKTLSTHPYEIGRGLLILYNVVPMLVYFFLLGRLLDRFGTTDWGRIFVMAAATLGTFLTTFAVTFNNHLTGAVCAVITVWATSRIWYDGQQGPGYFILAGFFAAFTAACELPALALLGLVGAGLLWRYPRPTLIYGLPAAVVVVAAYFGTNYIAHGSLKLPYAHRGDGRELFSQESSQLERVSAELNAGRVPARLRDQFAEHDRTLSDDVHIRTKTDPLASDQALRWVLEDRGNDASYTVRVASPSSQGTLAVHEFDDWYDYDFVRYDGRTIASYWRDPKGIDKGEPDLGRYALHVLVGHHGILSLTPVWLLMLPGVVLFCQRHLGYGYRALAGLIAMVTVVCVAFYILRPPLDRNYGGMTSGFRWVFWLAPLWLIAALPAADWLAAKRWGRLLGYLLLGLSVVSVVYPTWNPWTYPWLTNLWLYMGWEQF